MRGFWSALSGIFSRVLGNRRGSPTIEYVIVMSAAALLGLAIFNAVISEPVKKSMACAIKTQIARINQDASVLAGCEAFVGGGSSSHNRILQGASQFDQKSPYSSLSYEGSNHSPPNWGPLSDGNQQKPHIQPLGNKQDNGLWGSFKNGLGWLWDKTKEYSGKAWDFVGEKASDLWDWVKENPGKAITGAVVLILLLGSGVGEAGTAVTGLGAGAYTTLTEMGIGGFFGFWFMGDLTGGFTGALTAPLFRMSAQYIARTRLGMWIVERFGSTVGKWFSNSFGGAFSFFTDNAMYQSLKNGKVNLKSAILSGVIGALSPFVFHFMAPVFKQGMDLMLKIPVSPSLATAGGPAERATIGDTPLGQWLQRFAGEGENSVSASQLRNSPGTVTGGMQASDLPKMMRGSQGNIGLIPKEVADQLRGRHFNNFDDFRKAFWIAVANSKYASEFSASNVSRMRRGLAPFAIPEQWHGRLRSYILHHRKPIHDGGDVYDLDNLIIVTPKMHQEILDKSYHFGR